MTMVENGAIDSTSEASEKSYPDDELLIENQILTPKSSLRELQHRSNVRDDFNAWINGLSQGKTINTLFSNSGGRTVGGIML